MRENRRFVSSADMSGFVPATIGGRPAIAQFQALIGEIEKQAGRDAASLFAEPVLPSDGEAKGIATVSWYCAFDGAIMPLSAVDEVARKPVAEKLAKRLEALRQLTTHQQFGPALSTWLNIASEADVLSVGGEPLLTGWGFLPTATVNDADARGRHFAQTLGRFAPQLTPPPVSAEDPFQGPGGPQAPVAAASPAGFHSARKDTILAEENSMRRSFMAPLVACLIAAAVLVLLLWPGVLKFPVKDIAGRDGPELARLKAVNDSLSAQLAALQKVASERVCRAGPSSVSVPGDPAANMELLPRSPDQIMLPAQYNKYSDRVKTLANLMEGASVLVYAKADGDKPAVQGSGFFVNDHVIVTSRHLVQQADAGLAVASKTWGGAKRARLLSGKDSDTDLALLEIDAVPNQITLALGPAPTRLETVYAAGYPDFAKDADTALAKFVTDKSGPVSLNFAVPLVDLRYGRISALQADKSLVLHDLQLTQGHDGGALVDSCGRLAGVAIRLAADAGEQQPDAAQDVANLRKFLRDKDVAFQSSEGACVIETAQAPTPMPMPIIAPQQTPFPAPK